MRNFIFTAFLFISFNSFCQQSINIDSFFTARELNGLGKKFGEFEGSAKQLTITNKDLFGKIVFVNFWFEGCKPCVAEFDALNTMYDKLKSKPGFEFISFTYEPHEKVNEIVKKSGIQYKVISLSESEIRRLNMNSGFPTSFILDRQGIIKFVKHGGSSDKVAASKIVLSEFYPKILSEL
ncbi:MAG: TlpA disulfide reductase family protein [Bacteroidota bacterium]